MQERIVELAPEQIEAMPESAAPTIEHELQAEAPEAPREEESEVAAEAPTTQRRAHRPSCEEEGDAREASEHGARGREDPARKQKTSQVIAMLKREGGTTVEEIMTTMQWQKHTTRVMLSAGGSLTKKHGLVVFSEKAGDKRVYSIKA
jgi:hypothetical protein